MHPLPRPTTRVTAVLYADDVAQMKCRYGQGWTEQLRLMLEKNCKDYSSHRKTIEDIMRETDGQHE